ncbi:hypothetical protein HPP92_003868 [Vanilla planifolia]|uniref:Uncharacterized protein n=1 Tax=Vanilla planifolia TaxID=51239 RepID=A0A835S4G8_VANPL|nr:hypothetical protein HPP92_003868 [Vanilla planifolia]
MAEIAEGKVVVEAEKKKLEQTVAYYELFSFADRFDLLLMASGSLGAVVHGSAMPIFFLFFGDLYALYFVYLRLVVCVSSYAEIACWMYTGERQSGKLRRKYLEAVLKQDVGFLIQMHGLMPLGSEYFVMDHRQLLKLELYIPLLGWQRAWVLGAYGIACMSWALVFWYAGVFIRNGQTDGGKAFTAIFSAIVGGMSLGQSFSNLGAFSKGKAAGYKLMEIIRQKTSIIQNHADGKCLDEVHGNIELKDITFSYPSRPDVIIFRNFSLFFPAGKTVAVVGGSGSGKSTVVSLIERFYDPNNGQVLLDNVDVRTLQLRWLRDQIGLVNQEPALFATTILENILYGKADATIAEVEAATTAANAHSFITLLPNGYNTQNGEFSYLVARSSNCYCRAMLKNPKILLLDEATSALDAGSESIVQKALDRLMVGRTTVVEAGTHEELISKGNTGAYASLIRFQEMARNRDYGAPSTRRSRSSRLSHSLSTKSLSLRSGSLRNLSYQYSSGADGRIEMISNADNDRKYPAPDGYFFKLLKLNSPEWPYAFLGAIGSILSGFIGPTFAIVMSNMIEIFYYPDANTMERKTKDHPKEMKLDGLMRRTTPLIAARLATDAADVKSAIAERISVILQNMTSLLTSFIVGFIVEWRVALLILATFPLIVLANFAQQLSLKGFAGDTAKAHAKSSMIAGEGVSNIRTVAAFNAQDKILSLFGQELQVPQRRSLQRSQTSGFLFGLSQLALYGSEALILWYGAHLVRSGASTFSRVIKVFVVLVVTANSVAETVSLAPEIVRGGESIRSVFSILNRAPGSMRMMMQRQNQWSRFAVKLISSM